MKIGYLENTYPYKRCIIDCICENGVEYVQLQEKGESCLSIFARRVKNHLKYRMGISTAMDWNKEAIKYGKRYLNSKDVEFVHTFNTLYGGGQPWCCTFESQTPVTNDLVGRKWEVHNIDSIKVEPFSYHALKLCAKANCKGLIALSRSAYDIEVEMINRARISQGIKEEILKKVYLIHPPQKIAIDEEAMEKKWNDTKCIEMLFVGHDFLEKAD